MWKNRTPGWMRVTTWTVLVIQFVSPLFLALTPAARATEYQDYRTMSETMAGLQTLINEPRMLQRSSTPASTSPTTPASSTASTSTPATSSLSPSTVAPQPSAPAGLPDLGLPEHNDADPPSTEQWLAPKVAQAGQLLAEENVSASSINFARSVSEGMISQQVNDWLNHYGSARVSLGTDKLITGDLLLPLWDRESAILFSQMGLHSAQERNFANIGLGYRQYSSGWMFGINSFYDYDYTGKNARLGVGGEAWTDYLKLSANAYYGLTDWHQSPLKSMQDYDERPAKGVDMRAQGWLPGLPQLGATLKYERYFGKNIVLAAQSDPQALKDNPQAVTVGVNYTPFPLLTLSGERQFGDTYDTRLDLTMNYRFGVPFWQQISPAWVDAQRSLVGSKYEFVDRNYDIVMQYKKQQLVALSLPQRIAAEAGTTLRIPVTIARAKYGLKKLEWSASANFVAHGGSWQQPSLSELEVQVPAYVANQSRAQGAVQDYVLTVVGVDKNGNRSLPASTTLQVSPSYDIIRQMNVSPDAVQLADNKHAYTINAQAVDKNGQPLVARRITFSVTQLTDSSGASAATLFTDKEAHSSKLSVYTDNKGIASVNVQSRKAGEGTIVAVMDNGNSNSTRVAFIADVATAKLTGLEVTANNAMANGTQVNELRATVRDFYDNPLVNYAVAFSVDNGATMLGGNIAMTDQNGLAVMRLTHTRASTSNVTATVNSTSLSQAVNFLLDIATVDFAEAHARQDGIANGSDSNTLTVKLTDDFGNPVPGVTVKFSPDPAVTVTPAQLQTDARGTAQAALTSRRAGEFSVTANIVGNEHTAVIKTRFIADRYTATFSDEGLIISPDGAAANGSAWNGMRAKVVDAEGNPVEDKEVIFTIKTGPFTTDGKISYDESMVKISAISGPDGNVFTRISSIEAGTFTVTARVGEHTVEKNMLFVADKATAYIEYMKAEENYAAANNSAANLVSATVTDKYGNPVPGMKVAFTVTDGATLQNVNSITDANGKVTAEVVSTIAGDYFVNAAINGTSMNTKVTFNGDVATATITSVTLQDKVVDKEASSLNRFTFQALVKDANGNVLPMVGVRWKHSGGSRAFISNQTITDPTGIATGLLGNTGTEALNIQVSASLDDTTVVDADKTVNFLPVMRELRGAVYGTYGGYAANHLVQNATLKFYRNREDTKAAYTVSVANGAYSVRLPVGDWYVKVEATEYDPLEKTISLPAGDTKVEHFTLKHHLMGSAALITLTWQATPLDLDAHLMIPPAKTGSRFHIFALNRTPVGADAVLDKNAYTGSGPETINIAKMHPGTYCYSVHNPQPKLGTSVRGANVQLEMADGSKYSWQAPTGSDDLLWYVFKLIVDSQGNATVESVNRTLADAGGSFDNC